MTYEEDMFQCWMVARTISRCILDEDFYVRMADCYRGPVWMKRYNESQRLGWAFHAVCSALLLEGRIS